jgi:hypothetical protein
MSSVLVASAVHVCERLWREGLAGHPVPPVLLQGKRQ